MLFTDNNKFFTYTIIFSFSAHLICLATLFYFKSGILNKKFKEMEVTYNPLKNEPRVEYKMIQQPSPAQEKKLLETDKIIVKKDGIPQEIVKNITKTPPTISMEQKSIIPMDSFTNKRKVTIPYLKAEKITNPKYITFNTIFSQRVMTRAQMYIQNIPFEEGRVYLSFVVSADGNLKDVKIIDEKSDASATLKNLALRSVRDVSPFPPFAQDLPYPELTYNVVIAFQKGEQ